MKSILLFSVSLLFIANIANAQVQSPDDFLGYHLGEHFTNHQKVVDYFKYIAKNAENVKVEDYGKTYEGRSLILTYISSKENIDRLEEIRRQNLSLTQKETSVASNKKQPVIVWLSYNVHGNEASSTETAMKVLYTLVQAKDPQIKNWLQNTVVIIDPCLNPDGRERYVNYFNSVSSTPPDLNPAAREHTEPWPGGRTNHYYFDLNRDWAWQTQIETQQRLAQYHKWLPQVHVDFHEQGFNEPYYFAPAAEPVHEQVTGWQKEFQVIAGQNNAKYFDENGWRYFTKERFDLLYPSYGDTYPLYNGAIGMTYEQGGIRAGLGVITNDGDTLRLKDRIAHHFTTSLSTIEISSKYADKLLSEYKLFFEKNNTNPNGTYKSYVIKADNLYRIEQLANLLKKNHIQFAYGGNKPLTGYNFATKKSESFKLERNDLVISVYQPQAVLATVLFEPQTKITDSNTYDITAWALPFAYNLNAYALKEKIEGVHKDLYVKQPEKRQDQKPYAWVLPWQSVNDARILIALQKNGIKVRMAEQAFTANSMLHKAGSLVVLRAENERTIKGIEGVMSTFFADHKANGYVLTSSHVEKGKDFGSSGYPLLTAPKVAVVAGPEVTSQSLGEIWHFFETELNYPLSVVNFQSLPYMDKSNINTLILPDGGYNDKIAEQLLPWISAGGKLILVEDAINSFVEKKPYNIKLKSVTQTNKTQTTNVATYSKREQDDFENAIPGAIYKVYMDDTHPLTFGLGKDYYTLKTDDKLYEISNDAFNVGLLKADSYTSGIAGQTVKNRLSSGGTLYCTQSVGKGTVIYLATNSLFRNFWEAGKQMWVNGVFLF